MIIIGIAGGSGSGKTTIAMKIAEALPAGYAAVVHQDSYYNDTTGMSPDERRSINFDHPDAFDWNLLIQHLCDLKAGRPIEQPTYSYLFSNRLKETVHIEPRPVIIVEGIMVLHNKKLRDMMDLRIFIDTDDNERLNRNISRDTKERGRTADMVIERYEKVMKPMHEQFIEHTKRYADFILHNHDGQEKECVEKIINIIPN